MIVTSLQPPCRPQPSPSRCRCRRRCCGSYRIPQQLLAPDTSAAPAADVLGQEWVTQRQGDAERCLHVLGPAAVIVKTGDLDCSPELWTLILSAGSARTAAVAACVCKGLLAVVVGRLSASSNWDSTVWRGLCIKIARTRFPGRHPSDYFGSLLLQDERSEFHSPLPPCKSFRDLYCTFHACDSAKRHWSRRLALCEAFEKDLASRGSQAAGHASQVQAEWGGAFLQAPALKGLSGQHIHIECLVLQILLIVTAPPQRVLDALASMRGEMGPRDLFSPNHSQTLHALLSQGTLRAHSPLQAVDDLRLSRRPKLTRTEVQLLVACVQDPCFCLDSQEIKRSRFCRSAFALALSVLEIQDVFDRASGSVPDRAQVAIAYAAYDALLTDLKKAAIPGYTPTWTSRIN